MQDDSGCVNDRAQRIRQRLAKVHLNGIRQPVQSKPQPALIQRSGGDLVAQTFENRAGGISNRSGAMNRGERSDRFSPEQFIDRRQFAKELRFRASFHFSDYPMKTRPARLIRAYNVCRYASRSWISCGLNFWL